jgi:hypothetical protein
MSDLVFRKSSYSGGQSADCVEVASTATGVAVRDSKAPSGAILTLTAREWRALIKNNARIKIDVLSHQCKTRLRT